MLPAVPQRVKERFYKEYFTLNCSNSNNNKTLTYWRQKAVERLKSALQDKHDQVNEWLKSKNRASLKAEIILAKLSYLELKNILVALRNSLGFC